MFYGESHHYLFKMATAEATPMTRLSWPDLCRHVKLRFPAAWLPELEEISFFQLGNIQETGIFFNDRASTNAWEASLPPFFRDQEVQSRFASLQLKRVTAGDLRRLIALLHKEIAALYKEAIMVSHRKRRWGKEAEFHRPPLMIDIGDNFVPVTDFPHLTGYSAVPSLQVFELLWVCKQTDWSNESLLHVYI